MTNGVITARRDSFCDFLHNYQTPISAISVPVEGFFFVDVAVLIEMLGEMVNDTLL